MVSGVTAAILLSLVGAPLLQWQTRGGLGRAQWEALIWMTPTLFYLIGVWTIGSSLGDLAKGRLIQPTLADTLRRVGIALGLGGIVSVFVAPNLSRLLDFSRGGYLYFDTSGMTLGMIGGALFLLGRVVEKAGEIQAELDEII